MFCYCGKVIKFIDVTFLLDTKLDRKDKLFVVNEVRIGASTFALVFNGEFLLNLMDPSSIEIM